MNLQPLAQQLVFVNRWTCFCCSGKEAFIPVVFVCYWPLWGMSWGRGELATELVLYETFGCYSFYDRQPFQECGLLSSEPYLFMNLPLKLELPPS